MKNYLLILGFILPIIACAPTKDLEIKEVDVVLSKGSEEIVLLEDVFNIEDMIQLETSPECMISYIKRLEYYNDCYYILDNNIQQTVLVFDAQGHFMHKIGRLGHGKGEYITIVDFAIDREEKRIIMLSRNSLVLVYKLDGTFLFKKELDKSLFWNLTSNAHNLIFSTNNLTYTSGENAYLFYEFDKGLRLRRKFYPVLSEQMYAISAIPSKLYTLNNEFIYTDMYSHKSFLINQLGEIETCYNFQFKNPMPQRNFQNNDIFMAEQLKFDYLLDNMLLSKNIITFFYQDGKSRIAIADKSGNVLLNKVYGGIIPKFYFSDGDKIITAINAFDLKRMSEYSNLPRRGITIMPENNYVIATLKPHL